MQDPAWPSPITIRFPVGPGRAKARRLLLEQLRQAIATEPAALEAVPDLPAEHLTRIRARVSILVGTIVVRLNREGFAGSERIYCIRDGLATGLPVNPDDIRWLETAIAGEASEAAAQAS
jgi:hypothetical protein